MKLDRCKRGHSRSLTQISKGMTDHFSCDLVFQKNHTPPFKLVLPKKYWNCYEPNFFQHYIPKGKKTYLYSWKSRLSMIPKFTWSYVSTSLILETIIVEKGKKPMASHLLLCSVILDAQLVGGRKIFEH